MVLPSCSFSFLLLVGIIELASSQTTILTTLQTITTTRFIPTVPNLCDAALYAPPIMRSGFLKFPSRPSAYTNSIRCQWTIGRNLTGMGIKISFEMLDVEDSPTCEFDFIDILSGDGSTILKRYCGNRRIFSEFFAMTPIVVRFTSDDSVQGLGFNMTYFHKSLTDMTGTPFTTPPTTPSTTTGPVGYKCVATQQQNSTGGMIKFPASKSQYDNSADCEWTIRVPDTAEGIELTVQDFEVEESYGCPFDALIIETESGAVLGRACGKQNNTWSTDTGVFYQYQVDSNRFFFPMRTMKLRFVSDDSLSGRGFRISYVQKSDPRCSITRTEYSWGGVVTLQSRQMTPYLQSICFITLRSYQLGKDFEVDITSNDGYRCNNYQTQISTTSGRYLTDLCSSLSSRFIAYPEFTVLVYWYGFNQGSNNSIALTYQYRPEYSMCPMVNNRGDGGTVSYSWGSSSPVSICKFEISNLNQEGIEIMFNASNVQLMILSDNETVFYQSNGAYNSQQRNAVYLKINYVLVQLSSGSGGMYGASIDLAYRYKPDTRCVADWTRNTTGGRIRYPSRTAFFYNNENCNWTLETDQIDLGIELNFVLWDLGTSYWSNCDNIIRIQSRNNTDELSLCNDHAPSLTFLRMNSAILTFTSGYYGHIGSGFELVYTFQAEPSVTTTTAPSWSGYLGCFVDYDFNRDLDGYSNEMGTMTIDTCINLCNGANFMYAGLQNRYDCFCGNDYGKYGRASDSECNLPCGGNPDQLCGGMARNSIYSIYASGTTDQWMTSTRTPSWYWTTPAYPGNSTDYYTLTTTSDQCGGLVSTYPSGGSIQFPASGQYANNVRCSWRIESYDPSTVTADIYVMWTDIEAEPFCSFDSLRISTYSGDELTRLCGMNNQSQRVSSQDLPLSVDFSSDSIGTGRGFYLVYRLYPGTTPPSITTLYTGRTTNATRTTNPSTTPLPSTYWTTPPSTDSPLCSATMTSSDAGGYLRFPTTDQYANSLRCSWTIAGSNPYSIITIFLYWMDTEVATNCIYDSLTIYSPDGYVLDRLCNHIDTTQTLVYPYSALTLVFTSDTSVVGRGFELSYAFQGQPSNFTTTSSPNSTTRYPGSTSQQTTGTVMTTQATTTVGPCTSVQQRNNTDGSIQYPPTGTYGYQVHCTWLLQSLDPTQQTRITVLWTDIELSDRCVWDGLDIIGPNGNVIQSICGSNGSPSVYSYPYSSVSLSFRSDTTVNGRGFYLTYTFGRDLYVLAPCASFHQRTANGGTIVVPSQSLATVPANCSWTIQSNTSGVVDVMLSQMSIAQCDNLCSCASLTSVDAATGTPQRRVCGTLPWPLVDSYNTTSLRFDFKAASINTGASFNLSYWFKAAQPATNATVPCGISPNAAKIVGGVETIPGSWPWMAYLQIGMNSYCGASLISDRWAVTAAHCMESVSSPSDLVLRVGGHSMYSRQPSEQWFRAERFVKHEQYNTVNNDNDIAIIKLAGRTNAVPVCLPPANEETTVGSVLNATGWGDTEDGSLDPLAALRQVAMTVQDMALCGREFNVVTNNMICAGELAGGKDTCQGDSGGPLVQRQANGAYKIVGLTSFGNGCALPNAPGIYTKLSKYVDWMRTKMASFP